MKIILINRFFFPDYSATSQILTDLVFSPALKDFSTHVVTSRQRYDDSTARLAAEETIQDVKVHRVWTTSFGRSWLPGRALDYLTFYLSAMFCLMRLLSRGDIVVVKTDPPLISVVTLLIARLKGAVQINWIQDLFPEVAVALKVRGVGFISGFLVYLRNASLKSAAVNVMLGDRMASHLGQEGINNGKLKVIHNWADGQQVRPIPAETNELRNKWGLTGKFVIGYSGNMGRAHDFETILGAVEVLREEKGFVFLFIGNGPQRKRVEEEAVKRRLSNFIFKPYQAYESLGESLGASDVHLISLLPQLEGLIVPSKFYGIIAAGRPAIFIGDPDGEIAMIIKREKCGAVIKIGDAAGLADVIREWAGNPVLREELGKNGRRAFEQKYDKPIALAAWKQVLGI